MFILQFPLQLKCVSTPATCPEPLFIKAEPTASVITRRRESIPKATNPIKRLMIALLITKMR